MPARPAAFQKLSALGRPAACETPSGRAAGRKTTGTRAEWTTRPHEDTVEATVRWWEEQLGDRIEDAPRSQPAAWRLAGYAARAAGAIGGRIVR